MRPAILWMVMIVLLSFFPGCVPRTVIQPEVRETRESQFQTAERYFETKNYDLALEQFRKFVEQYPQSILAPAALMKIGQIHSDRKEYELGRLAYEQILEKYAYSVFAPDAGVEILTILFKQKKYNEVIRQSERIPKKTLSRIHVVRISVLAGDSFMALGRPLDAAYAYIAAHRPATSIERETIEEKLQSAYALLDDQGRREIENRLVSIRDTTLAETIRQMSMFRKDAIGCLLPLTGAYQAYGQKALKGIELALNRLGAREGRSFKIIVKDTASNPEKAVQGIDELVKEEVSCIIGPIADAQAAARAAQKRGIPIIVLSQVEGIPQTGDYVFRNFITSRMQAETLVDYAVDKLASRRFAILYPKEKYGADFMKLFSEAATRNHADVFAVEAYDTLGTDFSGPIRRVAALCRKQPTGAVEGPADDGSRTMNPGYTGGPDVIFIPDSPKKASLIVPQLLYNDVGSVQLFGTNLWHSDQFVKMAGSSARGAILPEGFFHLSPSYPVRTFVTAYQAAYGEVPGFIEAVSYDTAMIVFRALSGPGIYHRSRIRDALIAMPPFDGATGLTSFDESGEAKKQLYLLKITADGFVEIGR